MPFKYYFNIDTNGGNAFHYSPMTQVCILSYFLLTKKRMDLRNKVQLRPMSPYSSFSLFPTATQ